MKKAAIAFLVLLAFAAAWLPAQITAAVSGRYVDEKNKAILSIEPAEKGYVVRQISTPVDKDKAMNGQIVAKITSVTGTSMAGVAISLPSGKEYQATWEIQSGGSQIAMRVKAGIFHFNADWKRCGTTCS